MNTHTESSLKQRVLKGLMWLGSLTFIGQLITWGVSIVVIRLLAPQDYGLMAMASVFISFLSMLSEMGLGSALVQKKDLNRAERKQVFGFIIWIDCLLCLLVYWGAPLGAIYFSEPRLIPVLRVMSVSFLLISFYIVPQSILIRELDFRRKSIIEVSANLLSSGIVLFMAIYGLGVWSLIGGMLSTHIFKALLYNLRKQDRILPKFNVRGMGGMLQFGGYVSITRLLWFIYSQADILIGGRMFGKELLGVYSISIYLVSIPLNKISPLLNQVGFTAFSRKQEDLGSVQLNFLRLMRFCNILMFPAFIGLAITARELIPIALGNKWEAAIPMIQILCLVMPLRFVGVLFTPVVSGLGRPEIITGNMAVGVAVMVLAFIGGAHFWGIMGLCYAWLAAFPIVFAVMLKRVIPVLQLPLAKLKETVTVPIAGCAIMSCAIATFRYFVVGSISAYLYLGAAIVLGVVTYAAVVLILQPSVPRDIKAFLVR